MEEDWREPHARRLKRLPDARRDWPRGGRPLRAPRHPREQGLVRLHGPRVRVPVVDWPAQLRREGLEGPGRTREPEAGDARVLGAEWDPRGPDVEPLPGGDGEAGRAGRAPARDEEVPRPKELGQVLEPRVAVAVGQGHEEADVVPTAAPRLGRRPREQALGPLEDELRPHHAGPSPTAAWAWH